MSDVPGPLASALQDLYRLERELGQGGMATVYLAEDVRHHRKVAIKVLRPELAAVLGAERFVREIETTANLRHPHILPLYDSGEAAGFLFYVMPLVEGESLRDRLTREKQLTVDDALRIAREVADALSYAHAHGVIHRDIKPENILLESGHAVVADFGIAKAVRAAGGESLTRTGLSIGTPTYMSPEQAAGEQDLDGRSDLYALACVLYEMLAGQPPFTGATAEMLVRQHLVVDAPPITQLRPTVPAAVAAALQRALAKTPADRWQTAGELLAQLEDRTSTPSGATTPIVALDRPNGAILGRRRRWVLGAVSVIALVVAVLAIGALRHRGAGAGPHRPMLAVLPFKNLGPPEDEYFADGMTEEVTARLAGLHGLGVIGRTSADQYKQTSKTIAQIGQELRVEYVLEGSVRWDKSAQGPGRVRVTPQLIRVSDQSHVWATVYDAVLADVFGVQSSIATQVADSLDVALLAPERAVLETKPTTNLEAYDFYLRGKAYDLRVADRGEAQLAVQMYQRAVERDPTFALAYAALARAHLGLAWLHGQSGELPLAKAALDRAQQLGPDLAETHLALGYNAYWGSRNYDRALEQFTVVRQRQPNDPGLIGTMGFIHRRQGRWSEAVSDLTRATELDPRNASIVVSLGHTYGFLRRYAEADTTLGRAITLAPDIPIYQSHRAYFHLVEDGSVTRARQDLRQAARTVDPARILLGTAPIRHPALVRLFATDYGEALARFSLQAAQGDTAGYYWLKAEYHRARGDTMAARSDWDSARVVLEGRLAARGLDTPVGQNPVEVLLALTYAGLGRKVAALQMGRAGAQLLPVSRDAVVGPEWLLMLVEVYIRTGEYAAALDQLEYLLSIPSPVSIPLLRLDPLYAPLRGNPRFERLLRGKP